MAVNRPWLAVLLRVVRDELDRSAVDQRLRFSEFLSIQSTLAAGYSVWVTVIAATGVVLGAIYMLHLTAKLIFGPEVIPAETTMPSDTATMVAVTPRRVPDLNRRELTALLPLAALVLILGVHPNAVLDSIKAPVQTVMMNNTPPYQPDLAETTPHRGRHIRD